MGRMDRVALLCALCGVLFVAADAVRSHDSFAAQSYYDDNAAGKTDVPLRPQDDSSSQLPATRDDSSGAKYTVDNNESNADSPAERYPHGYYPNARYGPTTTTSNDASSAQQQHTSYTAVDSSKTSATGDSIPDRYPLGYYPSNHKGVGDPSFNFYHQSGGAQFSTVDNQQQQQQQQQYTSSESMPGERYPHGYNPDAQYSGPNSYNNNNNKQQYSGVSFTSQYGEQQQQGVNPAGERYPHGYYPNANYGGNAQTTQFNGAHDNSASYFAGQSGNYQAQSNFAGQSNNYAAHSNALPNNAGSYSTYDNPNGERYPHGYYPSSQYTNQGPKAVNNGANTGVSYSTAQGNFNTLPYPNNAGELPFEQTGAGCRTAYWADHVANWPRFFNAKSTVEQAFGSKAKEVFGETTIMQALVKYGTDPFSELLRSGCTAILNAYSRGLYSIPHTKVIEDFNAALASKEAATAQALAFETANVESISAGNACT